MPGNRLRPRSLSIIAGLLAVAIHATGHPVATASPRPARVDGVGTEWRMLNTKSLFEGAVVTDTAIGPKGIVAVGWTMDEPREPRAWFSKNGTKWRAARGNLGLPRGFQPGSQGRGASIIGTLRQFVVAHNGKDYVFVVRPDADSVPAGQHCGLMARMSRSGNGKRWKAVGPVDIGQGSACPLPNVDTPTSGGLGALVAGNRRAALGGVLFWYRAFSTSGNTAAVWSGGTGVPTLVSDDSDTFRPSGGASIVDGVVLADGRFVLVGSSSPNPIVGLVLLSDDGGRIWTQSRPGQGSANVTALRAAGLGPSGEVLAAGIDNGARVWRSPDGADWAEETVEGEGSWWSIDMAGGPWGAVIAGYGYLGSSRIGQVRVRDGNRWVSVAGDAFDDSEGVLLQATDGGVIAFSRTGAGTVLYASGNP